MPLPISVVVPRTAEAEDLYVQYCLPSIRENDPVEILAMNGDGDACSKRKDGSQKATQPFLLFMEEHVLLYEWALGKMVRTLEEFKDVSFIYSDWRHFTGKSAGKRKALPWDASKIQTENYVRLPVLMRREAFPQALDLKDPSGWDIWTTLAAAGHTGLYISEVLYEVHEERLPAKGVTP